MRLPYLLFFTVFTLAAPGAGCAETPPFADVHLHYNWSQLDNLTAAQAVARLHEQNVVLAAVSSTPSDLVLKLREAGGDWILPMFSPYLEGSSRYTWFNDPRVLPAARAALASGDYLGIGEFHLMPGIGVKRDNKIVVGLIELAIEFDAPLLVHTEASDYRYFLPICQAHPKARFLWAHAGGLLPPEQVAQLMDACNNVWIDMSARDPWRYVMTPIADENGRLLPGWERLMMKHPARFMTGADAVWPVEDKHNWYEADSGWDHLGEYLDFHRRWLSFLPADVEQKIRLDNARVFFRRTGRRPEEGVLFPPQGR